MKSLFICIIVVCGICTACTNGGRSIDDRETSNARQGISLESLEGLCRDTIVLRSLDLGVVRNYSPVSDIRKNVSTLASLSSLSTMIMDRYSSESKCQEVRSYGGALAVALLHALLRRDGLTETDSTRIRQWLWVQLVERGPEASRFGPRNLYEDEIRQRWLN